MDDDGVEVVEKVAVKKCKKLFEDDFRFSRRLMRELKIMRLMDHENLLGIKNIVRPLGEEFEELYIVSDMMEMDLDHWMQKEKLQTNDIKKVLY